MKIYTKTGDDGTTSLLNGVRVSKNHVNVECIGTIDELNSNIGLLRCKNKNSQHDLILHEIQNQLFVIGALLSAPFDKKTTNALLKNIKITQVDIQKIEAEIDFMEQNLQKMIHFILPGGHETVSYCHICRCVCRRAERLVVNLNQTEAVDLLIIQYLNRLSDYFFVLARKLSKELNICEIYWTLKE